VAEAQDKAPYPIESVDRALSLLLAFEETDTLGIAEASRRLGVSRSTAYRLLSMLEFKGFLRQDPRTKAYSGGPALLRVGLAAVRGMDLREHLRPLLISIAKEVDETSHLVILQRADAFFLDCVEGSRTIRAAARTGTSLPAHCTAGGKVLLAHLPDDRLEAVMAGTKLAALTKRSLTSAKKLERELRQIRAQGYARNDGESETGLRAVAVRVDQARDNAGIDAAITVSGPADRLDDDRLAEVVDVLRRHVAPAPLEA